jgi:hypothetical protein
MVSLNISPSSFAVSRLTVVPLPFAIVFVVGTFLETGRWIFIVSDVGGGGNDASMGDGGGAERICDIS